MKFRALAVLACVGLLAGTRAYADDTQSLDNPMLADNTSAAPAASAQADTWASNPAANENIGSPDLSTQTALNNTSSNPTDLSTPTGNTSNTDMSPDTATGDDY